MSRFTASFISFCETMYNVRIENTYDFTGRKIAFREMTISQKKNRGALVAVIRAYSQEAGRNAKCIKFAGQDFTDLEKGLTTARRLLKMAFEDERIEKCLIDNGLIDPNAPTFEELEAMDAEPKTPFTESMYISVKTSLKAAGDYSRNAYHRQGETGVKLYREALDLARSAARVILHCGIECRHAENVLADDIKFSDIDSCVFFMKKVLPIPSADPKPVVELMPTLPAVIDIQANETGLAAQVEREGFIDIVKEAAAIPLVSASLGMLLSVPLVFMALGA